MTARQQQFVADGSLLAVTLIWGVTFPIVKGALADAGPLSFNALRLSFAALLLLVVYRIPLLRIPRQVWVVSAVLGLCLALGYGLQTAGLNYTPPAVSAFLTSLSVILVPILLALAWRRRLRATVWIGSAIALAGLYLLLTQRGRTPVPAGLFWGYVLTALCAVAFALQIIVQGEWSPRLGFRELAVLQIVFAAVFTWLLLPAVDTPHWHFTPRLWIALAITAVLATAVAFTVQSWAQQFTPATHTAVIFAFEPVFAWLAALLGWHQALRPTQLAGAALIVAAMLIVERKQGGIQVQP